MYLTLGEVLSLHADLVETSGGTTGVRDLGRVQAALAQPIATFAGAELYPTVVTRPVPSDLHSPKVTHMSTGTRESGTPPWRCS
jgi:hypothetical protein